MPSAQQRVQTLLRGRALDGASALMDAVSHGVRALPPAARYAPADAVTLALSALWSSRRPVIERNFATMLGVSTAAPRVRALARASVRNFGRMAIDFLTVRTMTDAEVLSWVEPVGEEYFDEARSAGRGVILALPHFGSWDVAAAYAKARGWKLTVVMEANWMADLVAGSRAGERLTLVSRRQSPRELFRALAGKGYVAILTDLADDDLQTTEVPFFGRPAPFPIGPARLAQHTGAPILPIGCVRQRTGGYHIMAQPPLWPVHKGGDDAAVSLTAAMAAGFERYIAAYPEHWYPFRPIWPSPSPSPSPSATGLP